MTVTCSECPTEFVRVGRRRQFTCSAECSERRLALLERPTTPAECKHCGKSFRSKDRKHKYCSTSCQYAYRSAEYKARAERGLLQVQRPDHPRPTPSRTRFPSRRITVCDCTVCGAVFISRSVRVLLTCSPECGWERQADRMGLRDRKCAGCGDPLGRVSLKTLCGGCVEQRRAAARRVSRAQRKARLRGNVRESFDPRKIFERDGWRCGICSKRVGRSYKWPHDRSATLDHIVPLARGGEHTRANVQLAHWECNWRKRDALEETQLLMFG